MAGAKKKSPCSLSRGYSSLGACLPLSTAPLKANQSTIALCSRCVRSQPIHDCSLWPQVVKRRGMWPQHGCMLAVGEWVQPWLGAFLLGIPFHSRLCQSRVWPANAAPPVVSVVL